MMHAMQIANSSETRLAIGFLVRRIYFITSAAFWTQQVPVRATRDALSLQSNGAFHQSSPARRDAMPDYEIRFFHADGTLSVVHVSHHHSDEEALSHARGLIGDHARYEVRSGSRVVAGPKR
jgi:hypothetical protein